MRRLVPFLLVLCALPAAASASGDVLDTYALGSWFLPQTPSVTGGSPGAFYNPAAWALSERTDGAFYWTDVDVRPNSLDEWGLSFGRNVGFSAQTFTLPGGRFQDYQFGFAGGTEAATVGLSWRWLGGDRELAGRGNGLAIGSVTRPAPTLSLGWSVLFDGFVSPASGVIDLGVRPLGTPLVTVFGDLSATRGRSLGEFPWGVGVEVRPIRGTHVGVTVRGGEDRDLAWGLNLGATFDDLGVHVQPAYAEGGDHLQTATLLHVRPAHAGIPVSRAVREAVGPRIVVPVDLENRSVSYRRARWFDDDTVMWSELLETLDAVRDEPLAAGVLLNLSDARVRPSIAWEFRAKLQELQRAGKAVYVHGSRMTMNTYYLASVADRLTLDPRGRLLLPGLAAHRTYMKGFLDKIGIGSEEFRFFTHKTAFQQYTRTDMSDADREQLGDLVDSIYDTWRSAVTASRGIQPAAFDAVVDDDVYLPADLAVRRDLVDGTGRWEDFTTWLEANRGLSVQSLPGSPENRPHPDERWGPPDEIAVVYLVGECAMDSGIRARSTSRYLRTLRKKENLKALVLRVDSPGGDPMASDLVAHEVRAIGKRGVPVIVSQGDVAASGGYWLSMDADTVLATPVTVTGSIGVIAGWFWDDGFSGKTGFTADGVQRGKHADLFAGIRLPFVGGVIPGRALTDEERALARDRILEEYDAFVAHVAEGRGMTEARVRELGEGRVWMGAAALRENLVDGLGGLDRALSVARARAGLTGDDEVRITEYPPRPIFPEPAFWPGLPGVAALLGKGAPLPLPEAEAGDDYETVYTRILASAPGRPMLLVPPSALPAQWVRMD